jgi:hypothetical protein
MEGLRHHRVRQHRQNSPGRECEDDGNRPWRGCVQRDVAEQRSEAEARATRTQKRMIRRGSRPARSRAHVAAIASGRFATNTATRNAMLTVPASRTVRPRNEGLRNAVEDDSEDERAAGWRRPGLGRTTRCEPLDENLGPEAGPTRREGQVRPLRPRPRFRRPPERARTRTALIKTPAPKAMIKPTCRAVSETRRAIAPPITSDDPPTTPQRNASPIGWIVTEAPDDGPARNTRRPSRIRT